MRANDSTLQIPGGSVRSGHCHVQTTDARSGSEKLLERAGDADVHDIVCVGFGPAALAIGVALHDGLDAKQADSGLHTSALKVRFLERQRQFAWHPGMLIRGAKMQITFMKDMATLRNPRSRFTFLNYLQQKQRLLSFINLGSMLPQRVEYDDYMRWCASSFEDVVDYSTEVTGIEVGDIDPSTGAVHFFYIDSVDRNSGHQRRLRAKQVIIAVGGRPNIPKPFGGQRRGVIHSSQYVTGAVDALPKGVAPKRIAVVGAGQSAAEIFYDIPFRFAGAQAILVNRNAALKPSDDSPFVNELFNPERTDEVYNQDPVPRAQSITMNSATNYGVVRLELIERIYSTLYLHRLRGCQESDSPHRLLNNSMITGITETCDDDGRPELQLVIQNRSSTHLHGKSPDAENLLVDLVVVACGYVRDTHEHLLRGLQSLMFAGSADDKSWTVNRDYSVKFEHTALKPGRGVWLQGCNEKTHGLPDSLLSILAVRGGEVAQSIMQQMTFANDE